VASHEGSGSIKFVIYLLIILLFIVVQQSATFLCVWEFNFGLPFLRLFADSLCPLAQYNRINEPKFLALPVFCLLSFLEQTQNILKK
jgi:hypothetical protein